MTLRYRTGLAACQRPFAGACASVVLALIVQPLPAKAQRMDGAIGVSLTILPPSPAPALSVTGFRLAGDRMAMVRTAATAGSHSTAVVMTRLSRSTSDVSTPRYLRALPCEVAYTEHGREAEYRIEIAPSEPGAAEREVRLRMELLVVPGT